MYPFTLHHFRHFYIKRIKMLPANWSLKFEKMVDCQILDCSLHTRITHACKRVDSILLKTIYLSRQTFPLKKMLLLIQIPKSSLNNQIFSTIVFQGLSPISSRLCVYVHIWSFVVDWVNVLEWTTASHLWNLTTYSYAV